MHTEDIQKRIDKMPAAMSAKGLIEPKATILLNGNQEPSLLLQWYKTQKDRDVCRGTCESFRGRTIPDQLDAADRFIAGLPDKEEVKFKEFMSALGGVIDLGNRNGIEVEFLNPLVATMKKLSENALTDQRASS